MATTEQTVEGLEDVIDRYVSLGERDPLTIARKVENEYGKDWVASQLLMLSEDLLAVLARNKLGAVRRSAEMTLRPGDEIATAQMKVAKAWIPNEGWKQVAALTPADLRARAEWYESFAGGALRRAEWCREVAEMIEREGVKTLDKLKQTLPPLPDVPELTI